MKILIIDDERWLLENVATILGFEGYEVVTAPNGLAGVRAAREHMPDCIICDIMMPELDGYGVLKELQSQLSTASIPFIFLTARSDHSHRRLGMDLGADDYLTKPFTDEELLAAIRSRSEKNRLRELQQYQQLADHLVDSHEVEKQHIANLLRAHVYAKLTDLQLVLKLSKRLPRDALPWTFEHLQNMAEELTTRTEQILQEFQPYLLEEAGLIPALEWYLSGLGKTVHFENLNVQGRFEEKIERAVYRVVQHGLRLVSEQCWVVLWSEHHTLHLQITVETPVTLGDDFLTTIMSSIREYAQHCRGMLDAQFDSPCTIHLAIPNAQEKIPGLDPAPPHLSVPTTQMREVRLFVHLQDANLQRTLAVYIRSQTTFQIVEIEPDRDTLKASMRQARPDILVTDMSEMISPEYATIYLSVYDSPAFINTILQKGARAVVLKINATQDLLESVESVLVGRQFVSKDAQIGSSGLTPMLEAPPFTAFNIEKILTSREIEILHLILADKSHTEIGEALLISPRTVEKHRANLMQKLGLHTHTELILFAVRQGLLQG